MAGRRGLGGRVAGRGGRPAGQASAALLGFLGFHSSIILIPSPTSELFLIKKEMCPSLSLSP